MGTPSENPADVHGTNEAHEETGIVRVGGKRMSPTRAREIYVAQLTPAMMERAEDFRRELRALPDKAARKARIAEMRDQEPELIEAMEALAQHRKDQRTRLREETREIDEVASGIEHRMWEAIGDRVGEAANQTTPRRPSGAPPAGGGANDRHRRSA